MIINFRVVKVEQRTDFVILIYITTTITDYGGGVDNISVLKDISPPPPTEPTVLPRDSIFEALKTQTSAYKERIVTSTYIGRNIKQVRNFKLLMNYNGFNL